MSNMTKSEVEEFEKEWAEIAASKLETEDPEPEYVARMTKGGYIKISERDLSLIKRKARRRFQNPICNIYGEDSSKRNPDQLLNLNKLIFVQQVGDYDKTITEWRKSDSKCCLVVQTGPDLMISDHDFVIIGKRANRFDDTPIIELSGEVDGTIILNLRHLVYAYRK